MGVCMHDATHVTCVMAFHIFTHCQVIWQNLLNESSSSDKGTLWQLRNLISHSAVPKDPSKNVKAAEDFL